MAGRQHGGRHPGSARLAKPKRKRRPPKHPGSTPLVTTAPNDVWTTDSIGQFRMGDGELCYPLTVCDAHSRFVLRQFERLFREYGLPTAIRSDNGTSFATQAICGLSRLSVWWIKLGVDHQPARLGGAGSTQDSLSRTAPTSGCTGR